MMKLLLSSVAFGMLGLCMSTTAFANADQEFYRELEELSTPKKVTYGQKAADVKEVVIPKKDSAYKTTLQKALMFHNLLNSVKVQKMRLEAFRLAVLEKEITKARLDDFNTCNVGLLRPYFAQPDAVWGKLTAKTDEMVENYNLNTVVKAESLVQSDAELLASAGDAEAQLQQNQSKLKTTKNAKAHMDELASEYGIEVTKSVKGDITVGQESAAETAAAEKSWENNDDLVISEMAPEIDITFAILNQFYPHQDDWGKRVTTKTGSLPLWSDQKYLYNRYVWEPKYAAIRSYCKQRKRPLAMGEPKVSDEVKYDYYFYEDVKKAHQKFVAAAHAQECFLTDEMKEPPQVAPRPLPPVYEEIMVIRDGSGNLEKIYPQNPKDPSSLEVGAFKDGTLWEKYKSDNYKHIASGGEFDKYFNVSKSTLKATSAVDEIDGNRLSRYLEYKEDAANAVEAYDGFIDAATELRLNVEEAATISKIDMPKGLNYLKEQDLETIYNLFNSEKQKALQEVASQMGEKLVNIESKTAEQLQEDEEVAYYKALLDDSDAEVKITLEKALTMDEAIKEARANQKLTDLMNETANQAKLDELQGSKTVKGKNYKADTTNCLKQTKTRLLDINKVVIE